MAAAVAAAAAVEKVEHKWEGICFVLLSKTEFNKEELSTWFWTMSEKKQHKSNALGKFIITIVKVK
jgi:hypothetical protein